MKHFKYMTGARDVCDANRMWFVIAEDFFEKEEVFFLKTGVGQKTCMPYTDFPHDFFRELRSEERECRGFYCDLKPSDFKTNLTIFGATCGKVHTFTKDELSPIPYLLEVFEEKEKSVLLTGWCMSSEETEIALRDTKAAYRVRRTHRYDINRLFPKADQGTLSGFEIRIEKGENEIFPFALELKNKRATITVSLKRWDMHAYEVHEKKGFWWYVNKSKKAAKIFYEDGSAAVYRKIKKKIIKESSYGEWIAKYEPTREELAFQRRSSRDFSDPPHFSIVVPLYHTAPTLLNELLASVKAQTYENWELVLADASADEKGYSELEAILKKEGDRDTRIVYHKLQKNDGIAENTNRGIEIATGDFVAFCDHDDTLAPNALYECTKMIEDHPDCDVLYSDQDMLSEDGKRRFDPLMKPDFSIDFLRCCNYISHLFVVRKTLLDEVGCLDCAYDGSQDYDLTFRCVEKARGIFHIPKVLYHWRVAGTSTAEDPGTKTYAYEAGRRTIDAHFKRVGLDAHAEITEYYGKYRIRYHWDTNPKVSILIPNKDHISELDTCVKSLLKMDDQNFEIIVIENNSEEKETFAYYEKAQREIPNLKVVYYEGGFNYSAINNFGATFASGEYLLLLNNDIKIITPDFLDELLGYVQREDVGIVGPRLFYADGSIQHAGVVVGYGNVAGHAFLNFLPNAFGMLGRVVSTQNYSAVTAAALLTKKSCFDAVGGLTEELAVAFNDTDFCLKVRELGYLVVYTPFATAYHYESKSRGYETTPEKKARYEKEANIFRSRWSRILAEGDPYYSPNLTLDYADFSLK